MGISKYVAHRWLHIQCIKTNNQTIPAVDTGCALNVAKVFIYHDKRQIETT